MSSLLQSPLGVSRKGVEIYLQLKSENTDEHGRYVSRAPLYRIWRKPAGTWGCWVLIRLNGETVPMDFSVPRDVDRLPRDAERVSDEDAERYWSH